jgi:DNA repair exonuclease SbcCD ATPase subunit
MKNVKLKSLELRNFKGISSFKVSFEENETFIHGRNESGKTTIFDAFNWLLFNKNSNNETAFEIKTLNSDGSVKHRLEHEVIAFIEFDNRTLSLRKVLSEKWTKKRGSETEELTGNEIKYFIDDVPKSLAEYKAMIDLIIQESISRTITDPLYFNSVMPWKQRREILFQMVGIKSDLEILNEIDLDDKQLLIEILNQQKTLEDFKKEVAVKKSKLNEEIKLIPARIDEVSRVESENEIDFNSIEKQINLLKSNKDSIQLQIDSKVEAQKEIQEEIVAKNKLIFDLKQQIESERQRLKVESTKELNGFKNELEQNQNELIKLKRKDQEHAKEAAEIEARLRALNADLESLRNEFSEKEKEHLVFDEAACKCGECGRAFESTDIEERNQIQLDLFEAKKTRELNAIREQGKSKAEIIQRLETELVFYKNTSFNEEIKALEVCNETLINKIETTPVAEIQDNDFIKGLQAQIDSIKIPSVEITNDSQTLINKRSEIEQLINELNSKLYKREEIQKSKLRIDELKTELLNLNQEKTTLEKTEMLIEKFNRIKIENIEFNINNSFKIVNFKMFENQLNGGISECCVCTINGVPYSDANTASKLNAGLDVIQTLQHYFKVNAPIFIDNRESVTRINVSNEMQIINLIVDPTCETLTVKK